MRNEPEHIVLSQLNAGDVRKRLQIARLVFAARARGSCYLHPRSQPVTIEFAGDVMRRVIRAGRAGTPAFERVRGEILDDLPYAIDAGCAGSRLLRERDNRERYQQKERKAIKKFGFHVTSTALRVQPISILQD